MFRLEMFPAVCEAMFDRDQAGLMTSMNRFDVFGFDFLYRFYCRHSALLFFVVALNSPYYGENSNILSLKTADLPSQRLSVDRLAHHGVIRAFSQLGFTVKVQRRNRI